MPDKMIKSRKQKTCKPIDVAISADRTVVQKEEEKRLEYKRLWIEFKRMWNLKCRIIPVTYRATTILTEGLRKHLEATAGNIQ
jgi:hypothetical protein